MILLLSATSTAEVIFITDPLITDFFTARVILQFVYFLLKYKIFNVIHSSVKKKN